MTKYRFTEEEAQKFNKHGIDLTVYGEGVQRMNIARVSVKEGHFQEFYDTESYFVYSILSGEGTFYLNDEPVPAKPMDLIVIPPKTRIYYFGTMEMVLSVSPAYDESHERHIRFVDPSENPYKKAEQ